MPLAGRELAIPEVLVMRPSSVSQRVSYLENRKMAWEGAGDEDEAA